MWIGFLRCFSFAMIALMLFWQFGPTEKVGLTPQAKIELPEDLDSWLREQEAQYDDIIPGVERQIVWHEAGTRERTPISLVYLHGFSATAAEARPWPDLVANALGANLYYTRLQGHGRSGEAMAEASVQGWVDDVAEAIAIGRRIGERTVLIGASTGGTLATLAANDPAFGQVDALVLMSPNYRVKAAGAGLLTAPLARNWVPFVVGETRSWEPHNDVQAQYWTHEYPTVSVIPMGHLVEAVAAVDPASLNTPALFIVSDEDTVVDAKTTYKVASRWGGLNKLVDVKLGPNDDPSSHVLAGDILSPGKTQELTEQTVSWVRETLEL